MSTKRSSDNTINVRGLTQRHFGMLGGTVDSFVAGLGITFCCCCFDHRHGVAVLGVLTSVLTSVRYLTVPCWVCWPGSGKWHKFGRILVVVKPIHRPLWADISCTTTKKYSACAPSLQLHRFQWHTIAIVILFWHNKELFVTKKCLIEWHSAYTVVTVLAVPKVPPVIGYPCINPLG